MPHEDRVTAALEEIRADLTSLEQLITRMKSGASIPVAELNAAQDRLARHTQPLLAAIDGVLKLADSAYVMLANHETGHREPVAWDLDPAAVREAISSALLGETAPAGEGQ